MNKPSTITKLGFQEAQCDFCQGGLEPHQPVWQEWSGNQDEAEFALACATCHEAHHPRHDRKKKAAGGWDRYYASDPDLDHDYSMNG